MNQVLGSMGLLASLAAASVGSAEQGAQAALLERYAGLLEGSGNASLDQASGLLDAESQAVASGDAARSQSLAQSFAAIPPETVPPAYQPDASDMALSSGLTVLNSYDWASLFSALGSAVLAGLRGALSGGVYGSLAALALSLAESALQGEFTQTSATIEAASAGSIASSNGMGTGEGQSLAGALNVVSALQGTGTQVQAPGAPLNVPVGAAGQKVQPGRGAAAGGVLVGAQGDP